MLFEDLDLLCLSSTGTFLMETIFRTMLVGKVLFGPFWLFLAKFLAQLMDFFNLLSNRAVETLDLLQVLQLLQLALFSSFSQQRCSVVDLPSLLFA